MFIIIFVSRTLSWCQRVVRFSRNWENLTVIELNNNNNNGVNKRITVIKLTYTAFQEAFQEDFKYSDFFQDQASQRIGDVRREFILVDLKWDLKRQF